LGLVARGAASARSRLKSVLQPFVPLLLSWSGTGDLATLTVAEATERPVPLPPSQVLAGLYVNELLVRLLPRQDSLPGLFAAYRALLAELAAVADAEPPLRRFEKCLLEELGYGLSLDREAASGMPIVAEQRYCYVLDRGPLVADSGVSGVPISGRGLLALRDGMLVEVAGAGAEDAGTVPGQAGAVAGVMRFREFTRHPMTQMIALEKVVQNRLGLRRRHPRPQARHQPGRRR
jgi:DNA repair protein RecO (recombination protein O)